jgi:hypothetical protein
MVFELRQRHDLAAVVALELEGAGADGRDLVGRQVLGVVDLFPDMLGQDRDLAQRDRGEGRRGFGQVERHGQIARHLDRVDRREIGVEVAVFAVHVIVEGEGHVLGRHGLAVVPGHAIAQRHVDGDLVHRLDRLGRPRHRLHIRAQAHQAVIVEAHPLPAPNARRGQRVDVVGLLRAADAQRRAVAHRLGLHRHPFGIEPLARHRVHVGEGGVVVGHDLVAVKQDHHGHVGM